jgi:hypothetical protein
MPSNDCEVNEMRWLKRRWQQLQNWLSRRPVRVITTLLVLVFLLSPFIATRPVVDTFAKVGSIAALFMLLIGETRSDQNQRIPERKLVHRTKWNETVLIFPHPIFYRGNTTLKSISSRAKATLDGHPVYTLCLYRCELINQGDIDLKSLQIAISARENFLIETILAEDSDSLTSLDMLATQKTTIPCDLLKKGESLKIQVMVYCNSFPSFPIEPKLDVRQYELEYTQEPGPPS